MNLFYDTLALHSLGELTISQARTYEGGESPQRCQVTLKVGIRMFERGYDANYTLAKQALEALRKQHGVLRWTNTESGRDYVNQTATVTTANSPEEWGEYDQTLELTFTFFEQNLNAQNLPLLFKRTGSDAQITFEQVLKFAESGNTERFTTLRAQRRETRGKVVVSGLILADASQALATRRSALTTALVRYREQMNGAEGTLQFGASGSVFNRLVRVEEFTAELDQLANAINFSFTASYTLFPDEADYATVEYTVDQKDNLSGEETLAFTGKIQSPTETAARDKLTALTATVLTQYGYATASQLLRNDTTAAAVSANADGDTFTELTFTLEYRRWRTTNQQAKFTRTGKTVPIPFGNVRTWDVRYTARRFNEQRSQRQLAGGVIEASGTWTADPALTLADRRAALLAQQRAMLAEINGADGTLTYGDSTQVVRVENLTAQVGQTERGVDWSFTASYSLFPNEAGYATCDFSVAQNENAEDGEETLAFAGKILAPNGAAARAKLDLLRTSILGIYGYAATQKVRGGTTATGIDANGEKTATLNPAGGTALEGLEAATTDGVSFIELAFNEEYRRRKSNLVSWSMQVNVRDDVTTGLVATTYSGTVSASGANVAAAYAVALAKAEALGRTGIETALADPSGTASPKGFLKSAQINWEQRQTRDDNAIEFVRLTFTYEYQSVLAAGRSYLEVSAQTAKDTFGADTETVSGFVVAADAAKANVFYLAEVRSAYNGTLIRNEATTTHKVRAEKNTALTTQEVRLEFSFSVFKAKAVGSLAIRYSLNVTRDFLAAEKTTLLRGSVFAATSAAADTALTGFLGELAPGTAIRDVRTEDREWLSGGPSEETPGLFVKLDFDLTYVARLTGVSGLLEFRLTEEVQYSGTRWAVQPLPFTEDPPTGWNPNNPPSTSGGVAIVQPTGIEPGGRTVRGSVTAATRAACETWAKAQRALLTGSYPQPEKWDWDFEIVPRTQGLITGANPDVRLHRLTFTFSEILPGNPPPA